MKNIIIGGTTRAGKTTLANLIVGKLKYSKCESDTIVNAFDKVFPELGITHKGGEKAKAVYKPFLYEILNGFCRDLKYGGIVTVFPGAQFSPETIDNYPKKDKYIVIFLGVNAESPKALFDKIRSCDDASDWTQKKSDEWLVKYCEELIEKSDKLQKDCERFGFYYYNTFYDRDGVLNEVCDQIEKLQSEESFES